MIMEEPRSQINKCQQGIDLLYERLDGGKISQESFNDLLSQFPNCEHELSAIYEQWKSLELITVPQPGAEMHASFYKKLNELSASEIARPDIKKSRSILSLWPQSAGQFLLRHAAAIMLFVSGLAIGLFVNNTKELDAGVEMVGNNNNTISTLVYTTNTSSSIERISEIQRISEGEKLNSTIIEALNQALLKDPNTNVRLSAIEAMLHFADNPVVRKNLILAIPYQESPIVQLTLAEVMINLEEKGSREAWKQLLESETMESDVKMQLEETLKILI